MKNSKGRKAAYTAVMLLCVAAVGVSGYVFVTTAVRQGRRQVQTQVPKPVITAPSADMQQELTPPEKPEEKNPLQNAVPPTDGEILRPYSDAALQYDATNRDWRLHDAVDMGTQGQNVRAVMDGVVTSVTEDDLMGITVVLRHEGGYESRYCSLAPQPSVTVGGRVSAGDAIGVVGDTALSESAMEPHLHFQLLKDGTPVDPAVLGQ